MKPVVTRLYFLLVALTFAGLVAWAGADWYQLQDKAQDQAKATLRQAAGWVSELTVRKSPLDGVTLGRIFATATGTDARWKMLLLASARGTEYYRGPRPLVAVDRAVPQWQPQALTEIKVVIPVFLTSGEPMSLEGITEFYGRTEIFNLLRACALTLVLLLLLTLLVVVLPTRARTDEAEPEPEPAWRPSPSHDSSPKPTPSSNTSLAETEKDDEYWFDDDLTLEDLPPMQTLASETGLGVAESMESKLVAELERSSSQNQDLAVILLAMKGDRVDLSTWGDAVRAAFPVTELDFEQPGGAAVLLPGKTLEHALKAARAFVEACDLRLPAAVVHAGVAAASGRHLTAETLKGEADSALRRSLAGTVRVLGLKADPVKYREHLASASA